MRAGLGFLAFLTSTFLIISIEGTGYIPSVYYTARKLEKSFLRLGQSGFRRLDLVILLDRSGSIGKKNFKLAKKFLETTLRFFSISPSTTRVALIPFATHAKPVFKFDDNVNRECVIKALRNVRYTGGKTATGRALQESLKLFKETKSRAATTKTKRVVFILTDGKSSLGVKPYKVVKTLKSPKIEAEVFAFGIGYKINAKELRSMASSWRHIFRVEEYSDLEDVIDLSHSRPRNSCYGCNKVQYDECGRRCECKNGVLINCCRVRKDFTSMSHIERKRYIHAYLTASTKEPFKTKFRRLIAIHRRFFITRIHQRDEFLPWHRWFILELENLLREVDCRVTVPYWDWSLWSHDPWSNSSLSVWHDSKRGFGGNGVPPQQCVGAGPFREGVWSMTNGACLRRNFNGVVPDAAQVQFCLNLNADRFELFLRINLHDLVHCLIDGTMCTLDSAEAPEFFLHHGFIDKIWGDWQKKSLANKNAYFLNINQKLQASKYYPRDLVDISKQPGCVKVCYDEPTVHNAKNVRKFLKSLSTKAMAELPRMPFSKLNEHIMDMFKVSAKERKMAYDLESKSWKGIHKGKALKLRGQESVLGFKIRKPILSG